MSRVPASPHFFRPVKRAFALGLGVLCLLAVWFPAPLEIAAEPGAPPNPAKSAWFLLWIQELVSWNTLAIYAAVGLALLLLTLPWLPNVPVQRASWLPRDQRWTSVLAALAFVGVVVLTMIGLFFRGANWCFVMPF